MLRHIASLRFLQPQKAGRPGSCEYTLTHYSTETVDTAEVPRMPWGLAVENSPRSMPRYIVHTGPHRPQLQESSSGLRTFADCQLFATAPHRQCTLMGHQQCILHGKDHGTVDTPPPLFGDKN